MTRGFLLACACLVAGCSETTVNNYGGSGGDAQDASTGGADASSGGSGSGGATPTGGAQTGGEAATGGSPATGGIVSTGGTVGTGGATEDGSAYPDGMPKCQPGEIVCPGGGQLWCVPPNTGNGCGVACNSPCPNLPIAWQQHYAVQTCSNSGCDYECPDGWLKDPTDGCVDPCTGLSNALACGGTQFWNNGICSVCPSCPGNVYCCLSGGGCGCGTSYPNYGGCQ